MSDDLVTWLNVQLDEDERVARWLLSEVYGIYPDGHSDAGLAFMNRFDEARVLAEVDAKRRIVVEHYPVDPCDAQDAACRTIACDTLRLVALPYADRPGYRDEWRP